MLDICLLGTGGMLPLPDRWLASLLLRYKGRMILIDCGEGTQIPLKKSGWGFKGIDVILFTHYHADHIAGLPGLLLTIGNSGREEPLTLMGPPDLYKVVQGLTVIAPELPYELRLIELPGTEYFQVSHDNIADIVIESIPVDHGLPCLAYSIKIKRQGKFDVKKAEELDIPVNYWSRLQKGESIRLRDKAISPEMVLGPPRRGIKVCYCTDTRPTEDLADFIKDADLFICEGMYGEEGDSQKAVEKKHMTFSEAAHLAKQGDVKELYLTHYSPSLIDPEKYIDAAQEIFANTILGRDLLTTTIRYED